VVGEADVRGAILAAVVGLLVLAGADAVQLDGVVVPGGHQQVLAEVEV